VRTNLTSELKLTDGLLTDVCQLKDPEPRPRSFFCVGECFRNTSVAVRSGQVSSRKSTQHVCYQGVKVRSNLLHQVLQWCINHTLCC